VHTAQSNLANEMPDPSLGQCIFWPTWSSDSAATLVASAKSVSTMSPGQPRCQAPQATIAINAMAAQITTPACR
jgi:hypothetical protein